MFFNYSTLSLKPNKFILNNFFLNGKPNEERAKGLESFRQIKNQDNPCLGNLSYTLESRIYFMKKMAKILELLDGFQNDKITNREKIIIYILVFYYLFIFLMPFQRGTASIAEISFYSLWEYYLNEKVILNSNVFLDIEALTLPFNSFYDNFFNQDPNQIEYTPYLNNLTPIPLL